jgi:hypothetical protein
MQSKRSRAPAGSRKKRPRARKVKPGAVKGERLKPISLHGMEFDEVMRRLVRPMRPRSRSGP